MSENSALQNAEQALDAQIGMAARMAETAFRHVQVMPNATSLAAVTRTLDLLKSFLPEAESLRDQNRPATYTRLTMLLQDVTAARSTWAQTMGILIDADLKDTKKLMVHNAGSTALQKKLNEDLFKQGQDHAKENKKLL